MRLGLSIKHNENSPKKPAENTPRAQATKHVLPLHGDEPEALDPECYEPLPAPAQGKPRCPRWLGSIARKYWKETIEALEEIGLLSTVDNHLLALYCQCWQDFHAAIKSIDESGNGGIQFGEDGKAYKIPAVLQKDAAMDRIQKMQKEFGLTPSARRKMGADINKPKLKVHTRNRGAS